MADSKLTVTADYSGVVAGAAKAEKANDKTAQSAERIASSTDKAGKAAARAAKQAEGIGSAVGRSLMKIDLIRQAITAAGAAVRKLMDEASGASQTERERRLGAMGALVQLGSQDATGIVRDVERVQGVTTQQERAQFLQALAGTGRRLSDEDIRKLATAFAQYGKVAFGEGGQRLISELTRGGSAAAAIDRVVRKSPGLERVIGSTEFAQQVTLNELQSSTERRRADVGFSAELGRARLDEFAARNRTAGGLIAAVDTLSGGLAGEAIGGSLATNRTSAAVDALRENTRELRRSNNRATLGAQSEGAR